MPRPGVLLPHEIPVDLQVSGWTARTESRNILTELMCCADKFSKEGAQVFVSGGLGDSDNTFLADLAVGLQARFLRIGGVARAERLAKLRRLAEIEELLLEGDNLLAWQPLCPPKLELPPNYEEPVAEEQPQTSSQKKKK